jgi:uncharacterized cupredoxin-like copper-binding protein
LLAVLGGCGGGGDTAGTGGSSSEPPAGGAEDIEVAMTEFAFDPSEVSVGAGSEVTVTASNEGSIEHDLVVLDHGQEITAEDELPDDLDLVRSDAVLSLHADPGAADSGTFTAPAAGDYQVVCLVPGHFSAGMEGTLTVEG